MRKIHLFVTNNEQAYHCKITEKIFKFYRIGSSLQGTKQKSYFKNKVEGEWTYVVLFNKKKNVILFKITFSLDRTMMTSLVFECWDGLEICFFFLSIINQGSKKNVNVGWQHRPCLLPWKFFRGLNSGNNRPLQPSGYIFIFTPSKLWAKLVT